MRIPTLLALALILIAISLGIAIFYYTEQGLDQNRDLFKIKNIQVVNLSSTTAAITWQTAFPVTGQVLYDSNPTLLNQTASDERDAKSAKPHIVHFVTLKNLTPSTKYYYKIRSGQFLQPEAVQFTSAPDINSQEPPQNIPIRGTILDASLQPIDEALVLLKITGGSTLAAYTTLAGNFILPLIDLRTEDLTNYLQVKDKTEVTLEIMRGEVKSEVTMTIPTYHQSLPPIKLGENLDFKLFLASAAAQAETARGQNKINPGSATLNKFDLNGDGKVNAVDLSIILDNLGNKPKLKRADLNGDGVVNQKDIDLMEKNLQ